MKNKIALKITLIYFIIGFIWILFSDQLILRLVGSSDAITTIQTYKGWFFVGITAFLLFLLIRNELKKKNLIEADLMQAKLKAEESDHLKSAFLANISHEIRTPLNGILGFCELLLDDSFSEKDKQVFVKHMNKNGDDLLKMINDIIDISKIQENQFEIIRRKFNLNSLLDVIYLDYKKSELASMHNHVDFRLIKDAVDSEMELFSDPAILAQIFKNLLNNAFHFTTDGFIRFGYQTKETGIEFYVEDSGNGIDELTRELIFKPFFKGKNPVVGRKGFGLGLAISKGLVRLLGGDLQFTSTPNEGSRFYFHISNDIFQTEKAFTSEHGNKTLIMKAIHLNPLGNKLMQN